MTGESYELTAQSDEESLGYEWRVVGGSVVPNDAQTVLWTAPQAAGVAWIHVDVTREDGVTAGQSDYVRVEVPEPEPPPSPPPPQTNPDLVVGSPSVNDSSQTVGATFTLSATVRNDGDGDSPATTLRYYRSTDATISIADTEEGNQTVASLVASVSYVGSVDLTATATTGTYYYGACVDAVADESDITDNCSTAVQVEVSEPEQVPALPLIGQLLLGLGLLGGGARQLYRRQRVPPEA